MGSGRYWRGRVGVRKIEKRHRLEMTCAVFFIVKNIKNLLNEEKRMNKRKNFTKKFQKALDLYQ